MAPKRKSKKQLRAEVERRKGDRGSFDETVQTLTETARTKERNAPQANSKITSVEGSASASTMESQCEPAPAQSEVEAENEESTASTIRVAATNNAYADPGCDYKSESDDSIKSEQSGIETTTDRPVPIQSKEEPWCHPCTIF